MFCLNYFWVIDLSNMYWKILTSQGTNQNSPFHSGLICHIIKYNLHIYPSCMNDMDKFRTQNNFIWKLSMGLYKKTLPFSGSFVCPRYCVLPEKICTLPMEGFYVWAHLTGPPEIPAYLCTFRIYFWDSPLPLVAFHTLGIFWKYTFCNHFEALFPKFNFFLSKFRPSLEK